MATANSNCVSARPKDLISLSEVCKILGCSPQSARNWSANGEMPAPFRYGKSWRRWNRREIEAYAYGTENEQENKSGLVVTYCRCSTNSQREALLRQIKRVGDHARSQHPESTIIELSDNQSGGSFNRPSFLKMLAMMVNGELDGSTIYFEHRDRAGRVNISLLEKIAEIKNIRLVYIEEDSEKTDEEMLFQDVCAILHIYNCKNASKRGSRALAKPLDQKTVMRGKELIDSGLSLRATAKILTSEGHGNITHHQCRRYIAINETLKRVQPKVEKTSVELFAEKSHKVDDSVRTFIGTAYSHFQEFCTAYNLTVLSQKQFCKAFAQYRQVVMADEDGKNRRVWVGLTFDGVPYRVAKTRTQEPQNGLDGLLRFISKSRGFQGRLAGFNTNYKNWAAENNLEVLNRSQVQTALVQMGANLRRSNGIQLLAL